MKRIVEIDALRGFALFGILLVNIFVFHAPYSYYGEFYGSLEGLQSNVVELMIGLAGGKFLFIFAFLFGYGIALQLNSRKAHFKRYHTKRMLVLFLFGALHILLFWFGDILATYALLGLLILPIIYLSDRSILTVGILLLFFRPVYYVGVVLLGWPLIEFQKPTELDEFILTFQEGSFPKIFSLRMKELISFMPENLVWYIPKTMGLMLLGVYAAKKNFVNTIFNNSKRYGIMSIILVFLAIIWMVVKTDFFGLFDMDNTPIYRSMLIFINVLFETAQGFGYIIGFLLVFQKSQVICAMLAKTGRLALTNYILQSVFCVFIFYSYGFGLYGQLMPSDLVIICCTIFCFNVVFSNLYLSKKKMGPLEFVWRKLTGE